MGIPVAEIDVGATLRRLARRALALALACAAILLTTSPSDAAMADLLPGQESRSADTGTGGDSDGYHKAWFRAQGLNPGLPPPDRFLNRLTPRAALETFLWLGELEAFDAAAHLLDLSLIPEEEQAKRGPLLAARLYEILLRKVTINWSELPDRPDALETMAPKGATRAGEPRKSLRIDLLDVGSRPVSIRLNRIRPDGAEPVWVFGAQTVGNIPRLYEAFGPTRIEQRLPSWLTTSVLGRYSWWEVLTMPLLVGIACALAWGTYRLVGRFNRPLKVVWLHNAIRRSRAPAALIVAISFFYFSTGMIGVFSGPVYNVLQPILVGLLIGSFTWLCLRFVDTALDFATSRYVGELSVEENSHSRHLYTNISVLRRVVLLIAVFAAAGLVFEELHAFESVGGALLASAGILSIVLGFAAQTVLGNIISSLQIAIAKPIRIGDTILYEDQWGYVEEINYTYVLIRVWNDRRLVVPVRHFVGQPFENWSIRDTRITMPVELTLDHRTDVQAMREKFTELLQSDDRRDEKQEPKTLVISQDERGMVVRFYAGAKDAGEAWALQCDLREKLLVHARELEDERYLPHTRVSVTGRVANAD